MKKIMLTMLLLVTAVGLKAQGIVKGVVTDTHGETIIGATVKVKGVTDAVAATDIDGKFSINVPTKDATLVFTYIGMKPLEVKVGSKHELKVVMEDNQTKLKEVVVVGYGQQKKASVVGAITQTDSKTLERTGGVSSLGAALTGNLPGVTTMSSSGSPGEEDPEIVIRGVTSWNSSAPLILVDGIERPMSSIDISSVENVSVLKDASATAVYGVKGANGVILITTKRGQDGKARVQVSMNAVMKTVSKLPSKYDAYDALTIRNMAIENELGLYPESWTKITPQDIINKYRHPADLTEKERYPNVDWADVLFGGHAMSYNPNVSISGGTKNVKYFASIDYIHEGDMFNHVNNNRGYKAGYGFDRINVRSNLDINLTHTTLLKANIFGSHGIRRGSYGITLNSYYETQLWQAAYSAPPDAYWPRYSDGTWGYYPADTQGAPNSLVNLAIGGIEKHTTTRINTDFTIEQKLDFLLKGLKANFTISWDNTFVENRRGIADELNNPQYKWINPDTGETTWKESTQDNTNFDFQEGIKWTPSAGTVDDGATQRNLYYQAQLYWANTFGKHDLSAMGVFNRTERTLGSEFTNYREDWAFRATYAYGGRYFAEYNGAYNGSERFAKKNRFAFFNSGAVGWMVSEEKFWDKIRKYVPMLKFRYSIGEVGDDNISTRWMYLTQWAYGGNMLQGLNMQQSPYTFYKEAVVGNPDVHWEKAVKRNFGIDYSFFDGLLSGSADFFSERRSDILVAGSERAIPQYFGTAAPTANLGRVKSHGYELELRVNKVLKNGMRLWGNFNTTHAESKILDRNDAPGLPAYQKQAGYTIGQHHGYLTSGFANTWDQIIGMTEYNTNDDQNLPGQFVTIDYNADGVIDANDAAPYGYSSIPQNTYSASIGWEWKGWSLYCQFYGVTNVTRYVVFDDFSGRLDNVYDHGSFWNKETMSGEIPIPRWNSTPNNDYFRGTTAYYDGSYIRLKNAEIAYTFTQRWVKLMGITSLKVYLNGNNLWMWSHMPDDRETNTAGTGNASQGAYPTVKRFNLGIKLTL
jgi:TonB-linked SusC/RagA family outer membrane protein